MGTVPPKTPVIFGGVGLELSGPAPELFIENKTCTCTGCGFKSKQNKCPYCGVEK